MWLTCVLLLKASRRTRMAVRVQRGMDGNLPVASPTTNVRENAMAGLDHVVFGEFVKVCGFGAARPICLIERFLCTACRWAARVQSSHAPLSHRSLALVVPALYAWFARGLRVCATVRLFLQPTLFFVRARHIEHCLRPLRLTVHEHAAMIYCSAPLNSRSLLRQSTGCVLGLRGHLEFRPRLRFAVARARHSL